MLRITEFLGIVHHPVFQKLDLFPSSGEGVETRSLLDLLELMQLKLAVSNRPGGASHCFI
jgi:hypothetical protein